ncbi:MAG: hypothetical protein K6F61_06655 [Clostridiales bacterium]|nr:hypothetical protein [Clostridiales bacterium]
MMNRKRIGVLLVCIGLVIALSVSVFYIAHEAHHDCCGEDCPVCETIAVNVRLLRTLGLALFALLLFRFRLPAQASRRDRREKCARFVQGTLVSWKIRLDN